MELLKFNTKKKANEGAFLHLVDPTDNVTPLYDDAGTPVGLYLMGKDSDYWNEKLNDSFKKLKSKSKKSEDDDLFAIREKTAEMLADMTTGWSGMTLNGSAEFSRAIIKNIYADTGWNWLKVQADRFIDNDTNFFEQRVTG